MEPCFALQFDFFGTAKYGNELSLELPSETANHFRSRRIRAFENIFLIFPREYKVLAEVRRVNLPDVDVNVIDWTRVQPPEPKINLHWGLPERNKISDALRVIGQFPITNLVLEATERSVNREVTANDKQRWERALLHACEITGSGWMPVIVHNQPMFVGSGLRLLCQEGVDAQTPESVLKTRRLPEVISVLIGPEGGFSDAERDLAKENGWQEISLGRWNFTTEAAIYNVLSRICKDVTW